MPFWCRTTILFVMVTNLLQARDFPFYSKLKVFGTTEHKTGVGPSTGLVQDENGFLYGSTYSGGASNAGTIFRAKSDGTDLTVLKPFGAVSKLALTQDGFIFGTTADSIFRMRRSGADYQTILRVRLRSFPLLNSARYS
jgi:uncharacterized repeat protein (TIGR03803 family)